jgi:type IV pilus assembly protein PilQ
MMKVGIKMGSFLSAYRNQGVVLVGVLFLLVTLMLAGCVSTHKEEKPAVKTVSEAVATDSGLSRINAIRVLPGDEQLVVWIEGGGPLEYTSIKQAFPFSVSVYLPNTSIPPGVVPAPFSDSRVSTVRAGYADEAKTIAKIDILLTQDLSYEVTEEGDRIGVHILGRAVPGLLDEKTEPITEPAEATVSANSVANEDDSVVVPNKRAEVNRIEFDTRPTGHSEVRVMTSHPVKYETRQVAEGRLSLILFNTTIPESHQRPLLTRYFNSAVEKVIPGGGKSSDARIDIQIRDQVPFHVVQTPAGIKMAFEPSSVEPPVFNRALAVQGQSDVALQDDDDLVAQSQHGGAQAMAPIAKIAKSAQPKPDPEEMVIEDIDTLTGSGDRVYSGEKIQLEFYETDIKNVFRILKSVSGYNFAIDGNVQGQVTLSMIHPLPWDQVLDLVLKMNQLGKKREGNVYRIATLETIKLEEEELQAAIKARKESIEQKKSLEPMITEYIRINYADIGSIAGAAIPLMTESKAENAKVYQADDATFKVRGSISIDTRTNTLIITDTQAKLNQIHELIYELDKVTPQIIIEAKVVEVSKDFSRSFGLDWNLSNASGNTSGYIDDFNVSINEATTGIAGDFTFFRLFGSSMTALNAQLEASEELGDVRIVSSPRILTLDNKEAVIKQGQEYAYLERDDTGGSSVKYKEIELVLTVTPHVTADKRISMNVNLTKDDVAGFIQLQGDQVPILATNEASTELLVDNNETVVIGGVVKTSQTNDDDGIPLLRGIPLLGYLFSTKAETDNRDELLIFITPSIVQLEQKKTTVSNTVRR